jgi:hypothetical protein
MLRIYKQLLLAGLVLGASQTYGQAAEREDVRKVINLLSAVKMPYPETLSASRAKTERVWLERGGTTTGCLVIDERRWCYEHIPPEGARAEMLRVRNEPSRGVSIGSTYYYIVDFDLEGLVDVGSTTEIERTEGKRGNPIGEVHQFFHRGTGRGDTAQAEYQKMYDEGIRIALKYFGE